MKLDAEERRRVGEVELRKICTSSEITLAVVNITCLYREPSIRKENIKLGAKQERGFLDSHQSSRPGCLLVAQRWVLEVYHPDLRSTPETAAR